MTNKGGVLEPKVNRDISKLAPKFAEAVTKAIAECRTKGYPAMIYEGYRNAELQAFYYARGRTIIPPTHTVTNAPTQLYSWHGYGLAVDVVHETKYWDPPEGEKWFKEVAAIFKQNQCNWGGDWTKPDTPHFQWHRCKPSPSAEARQLIASGGLAAVWEKVDAA
jgi:peptidoglycan L-alanyl-D-glutamate endopeptidase CwlK